jgi:hypothetical protein
MVNNSLLMVLTLSMARMTVMGLMTMGSLAVVDISTSLSSLNGGHTDGHSYVYDDHHDTLTVDFLI